MKRLLTYILLILAATLGAQAADADVLKFDNTKHDFGTITDDHAPIVYEYRFTNTSDEAVAVLSVSTGCGCTRPEYPLKPVAPGKSAVIKITFLPAGQRGNIEKVITVRYRSAKARSSKRTKLRLNGIVTPAN